MPKSKTKTEHCGGKNGGGFWGTREEAKSVSKSLRRRNDKRAIKEQCKNTTNQNVSYKKIQKIETADSK